MNRSSRLHDLECCKRNAHDCWYLRSCISALWLLQGSSSFWIGLEESLQPVHICVQTLLSHPTDRRLAASSLKLLLLLIHTCKRKCDLYTRPQCAKPGCREDTVLVLQAGQNYAAHAGH